MEMEKEDTQAKRFGKVLMDLKPDVTEDDRKAAIKETGVTHATIVAYLKGNVRNNDLAASLIGIFRQRISDREKVIA